MKKPAFNWPVPHKEARICVCLLGAFFVESVQALCERGYVGYGGEIVDLMLIPVVILYGIWSRWERQYRAQMEAKRQGKTYRVKRQIRKAA